jgi:hypothetical protein
MARDVEDGAAAPATGKRDREGLASTLNAFEGPVLSPSSAPTRHGAA